MKQRIGILVLVLAALGLGQTGKVNRWRYVSNNTSATGPALEISSGNIQRVGSLARLSGQVEIKSQTVTLVADRVDLNFQTGEATAEGHVRFKMLELPGQK